MKKPKQINAEICFFCGKTPKMSLVFPEEQAN